MQANESSPRKNAILLLKIQTHPRKKKSKRDKDYIDLSNDSAKNRIGKGHEA